MGLANPYRKLRARFNVYIFRDEFLSNDPYVATHPTGIWGRYLDWCDWHPRRGKVALAITEVLMDLHVI